MTIIIGVLVTNYPLRVYLESVKVGPRLWEMEKSLNDTENKIHMHKVLNHLIKPKMSTNIVCVFSENLVKKSVAQDN